MEEVQLDIDLVTNRVCRFTGRVVRRPRRRRPIPFAQAMQDYQALFLDGDTWLTRQEDTLDG